MHHISECCSSSASWLSRREFDHKYFLLGKDAILLFLHCHFLKLRYESSRLMEISDLRYFVIPSKVHDYFSLARNYLASKQFVPPKCHNLVIHFLFAGPCSASPSPRTIPAGCIDCAPTKSTISDSRCSLAGVGRRRSKRCLLPDLQVSIFDLLFVDILGKYHVFYDNILF